MQQIVYISTAMRAICGADLDNILATSRRNNAAVQVTGALLVGGQRFLQAIEGPADAVNATFDRIRADPRHNALVTLSNKSIAARQFGSWVMAFDGGRGPFESGLLLTVRRLERFSIIPDCIRRR